MIKTLSNLLKQDKEKYKVPRKVQDVIPIRRMWSDGIFQVGSKFSKSYQFSDINSRWPVWRTKRSCSLTIRSC